ncbi:hypothetical protein CB0940_02097 [Cercospora beticola]|uniref:2EXR domain-containing protein n=1 Tax=Cercospora beticola TaxID=122368 RepID=A0A2G5I960_CERBT|nr:hypothetical protein CB0940_02097 [Cercospora beticola]PIB01335.1 hypothetical protein CB0940_02097 [Cercospora beticola]CAK1358979.1 unnamed protein product [Cercospora beticola]
MAKVGHTCVDRVLSSRNDISHVEEFQPYISSCSEAMPEWINPTKFLNRPPRGELPLEIELHSANSQLSSPLFSKLSGELRSLIYSFVFPPQTVHVHLKACRANDRWTRAHISQQECWPLDGDEDPTATPETYEARSFMKTTSHACSFPHDWERQYALSNHPEAIPQQYLNKNGRPSL